MSCVPGDTVPPNFDYTKRLLTLTPAGAESDSNASVNGA